jgi:hypothetical protein
MAIRVTQVGNEVWVRNPSNIRVTQIGNEVWLRNPSNIRVTQVGKEVWRTTANAPAPTAGHADGSASVSGIVGSSSGAGHADGQATVSGTSKMPAQMLGNANGFSTAIAFTPSSMVAKRGTAALMAGL